jgi:hypothetical protein
MKPCRWFMTVIVFLSVCAACTTRSESSVFEQGNLRAAGPALPDGYILLSETRYDTDGDNEAEIVLFGYRDRDILLLVFDLDALGRWQKYILVSTRYTVPSGDMIQELVCIVNPDWIGWGPPASEPYEIFVWDGKTYTTPAFFM